MPAVERPCTSRLCKRGEQLGAPAVLGVEGGGWTGVRLLGVEQLTAKAPVKMSSTACPTLLDIGPASAVSCNPASVLDGGQAASLPSGRADATRRLGGTRLEVMVERVGVVAVMAAVTLAVAACTGDGAHQDQPTAPASGTSVSAKPSAPSTVAPATTPATGGAATLTCRNYIAIHPPLEGYQVVLGVVALPTSPTHPALQTAGDGSESPRLFAKTGLLVKAGTSFELIIPADVPRSAGRVGIGWGGAPSAPTRSVAVGPCRSPAAGGWLAYVGGYWIDHPVCLPLIVQANGRRQQVRIGLGTPCPGQRPPQGPSDR